MGKRTVLAITILLAALPSSADDNWNQYLGLINKYYFIDDIAVTRLECTITSVPGVNEIKSALKPFDRYVEVTENLNEFKVRYTKGIGFTVDEPRFLVRVASTEGIRDLQQFLGGVAKINMGAAEFISSAKKTVESTLGRYIRPRRDELPNLRVTRLADSAVVEYTADGYKNKEVHSKDEVRLSAVDSPFDGEITTFMAPLDNWLAPSRVVINGKIADSRITSDISIQCQRVGNFGFPSVIEEHGRIDTASSHTDVKYSFNISQCTFH